jgi:protein-L-isoaspartate(D-aspartate) O-methyltransferase
MSKLEENRQRMVREQIAARGVRSELVLNAMRQVPREAFLPERLHEFAYDDTPLPIAEGQTISQPYIVAYMVESLGLSGGEKVLEIGAGSGYAAAVLARIAGEVYTIEYIEKLAENALGALVKIGCDNVHVIHADGTLGWELEAPYDAIVVTAGGPRIPESLKQQLKIGGCMVIPVGTQERAQELVRVTRLSETDFKTEDLADVRFVPLVGEEGWSKTGEAAPRVKSKPAKPEPVAKPLNEQILDACEPFESIEQANLEPLLERIGDARVVLLGEASHGTSEFYRMRERITRELISRKGFNFVGIEGDWPDAARIDHYVRHFEYPASEWTAFARFPTWMWRNNEVRQFIDWLREFNSGRELPKRVAFHGLDLYSLYNSIRAILEYLDEVDPQTAEIARQRYGCLGPWQSDPAAYGQAALNDRYHSCEEAVTRMLKDLLTKEAKFAEHDGERFMDAVQNARLVANAEQYYRIMYYGSRASWNLRDSHMFETLMTQLEFYGEDSKAIVWAHNSHVGNAAATEMSARGETNIGELCRKEFGDSVYSIGFGTHTGTVAAASNWDAPMEIKRVVPSMPGSYERLFHESGCPRFLLGLKALGESELGLALSEPLLERAIGVIYRPESERASHYFYATLPQQFDEYIWMDETEAVTAFETAELAGLPDTYPFGI